MRGRCGRAPGLPAEHGVTVLNAPGTIDADYRGEVKVLLINHGDARRSRITRGMRIAQLVVAPVASRRCSRWRRCRRARAGQGGFGSTGVSG